MPPSEQQQDGITDGEGTRIEATNSPSQNTGRLQASPQPTEASSHNAPPQAGAISLLLALFQWLHDQLRDQHISTQLFASQEGQYYQKNLHLKFSFIPPKSLEQMLFSTNKTNKEKKKIKFHRDRTIISESILPTCRSMGHFQSSPDVPQTNTCGRSGPILLPNTCQ